MIKKEGMVMKGERECGKIKWEGKWEAKQEGKVGREREKGIQEGGKGKGEGENEKGKWKKMKDRWKWREAKRKAGRTLGACPSV
jgi:hypothetical protein